MGMLLLSETLKCEPLRLFTSSLLPVCFPFHFIACTPLATEAAGLLCPPQSRPGASDPAVALEDVSGLKQTKHHPPHVPRNTLCLCLDRAQPLLGILFGSSISLLPTSFQSCPLHFPLHFFVTNNTPLRPELPGKPHSYVGSHQG